MILQDLQYFSQPACKTDFAQYLYFGLPIPQKNMRVSMVVFTGTAQDQCLKIAIIFEEFY